MTDLSVTISDGRRPDIAADFHFPPRGSQSELLPAVIVVGGYPDAGFHRVSGTGFRHSESTLATCKRIAEAGFVGVAYSPKDPAQDGLAVVRYLRTRGAEHGVNPSRLALWATSGNGPVALGLLARGLALGLRCAAFWYPYLIDSETDSAVADASREWGFVHATAGLRMQDLDPSVPVLLVRAGQDAFPGLLAGVDRFMARSVEEGLPVTCVNYPTGEHAFDFQDKGPGAVAVEVEVMAFFKTHLGHHI